MLIENELTYPIYSFSARWSQDGEQDPRYSNWHKDLPKGRVWNSIGRNKMYKSNSVDLEDELNEWWTHFLEHNKDKDKYKTIKDLELEFKFVRNEVWCLSWFQHWTFDIGQSNIDALNSFQQFVYRTEQTNRLEGKMVDGLWREPHCLMGAEDRWRWCGFIDKDTGDKDNPPCRCKHCKELGIIRISH